MNTREKGSENMGVSVADLMRILIGRFLDSESKELKSSEIPKNKAI